jgi:spore germination protein GerM
MIPSGVRLRNVYVRCNTAYIDFSDEFRFNSLGQIGLQAQVSQVVYTATEFKNVRDVQILIEGQKIEYLSSEGPFIGSPISRERLMDGLI